ncbi:MAG: ABC transporter ATP-binding protein [Syntrophorhabdus sp.]|jgi:branched-chain amino acid transport system ATP-binding protein|nr:ABC transporter ATP-binding protein [Syntrophorhabdus sp.]
MNLLETKDLTKAFGGVVAVSDLNLSIREGIVFGVVGPNGAGKTTLINVITGVERVTKGSILFKGRNIGKLPTFKRSLEGITRTFQIPQCFTGLTVFENILIPLLLRFPTQEAKKEAERIAERMFLKDDLDKQAQMLSVGRLKLLELAKAYATSPKLLLVDEPMGGVSLDMMDSLIDLIKSLRDEGITILLVEHVMKVVVALADELVVLNFGKEIALGKPEDVMNRKEVIEAYLGDEYA